MAFVCLGCAALAGFAAHALGVPLAWILGPMVATAAFAMAGTQPIAPVVGRRFGQLIIGASIGLRMTPAVLAGLVGWIPLMVVSALLAMLVSAALSVLFSQVARIDGKTAYFAMLPGGMAEMANIGATSGARSEPIALAQSLRVAIVVCLLPPLIVGLGINGDIYPSAARSALPPAQLALLLVAAIAGIFVVRLLRLNNPWMIGALLGGAALTATGLVTGQVPRALFYLGQFLIGITVGARFRREIVARLLRLTFASSVFVLLLTAILLLYAALLASVSDIDLASAALATSPGGFAEMTATAETLHLSVALVTAFHFARALLVNGLASHLWTLLDRTAFFRRIERLSNRWFGPSPS
jgi:membrane AbrB-like protein